MAVPSTTNGPDAAAEPDPFEFSFRCPFSPPAMCAADDIFLAGKILPFGAPPPPPKRAETSGDLRWKPEPPAAAAQGPDRLRRLWSGGPKTGYRRMRRVSDCDDGKALLEKAPPQVSARQQRPRWYLWVLGSVRLPATMDMSDIKNRQRRKILAAETGNDLNGGGSWKLLRSLSCRGLESATVVTVPPPLNLAAAHV
ncbi:hypothetical protein Cni_G01363 [Canna indica]|uniref:Uncharacterized protein n=1 Tax=Canna indica TaxID=4628 RepID=A0AAQ3JP62_9LILI|nr:hypothetical protein Cni_G01363 [Canna indica]